MINQEGKEVTQEQVNQYLMELRRSGAVNMFGTVPYIVDTFKLPYKVAKAMHFHWITTFEDTDAN